MKIDSPKFAPAPRPAPAPAAASNTGIVPTAKHPTDSFETASARPSTAATGNTGITGAGTTSAAGKSSASELDFELDPALEPNRELFAKLGSKIAQLPTEEERTKAIEKTSARLSKVLNQPLDKVTTGLGNAVRAALAHGPSTTRDPQCFRADRLLSHSPKLLSVADALQNIGLSLSKDSALKSKKDILEAAKPQLDPLNLKGRDLKMAQRYITSLVREDRARTAGSLHGQPLPHFNSGTFQFLPRE
jgi:hypothetical protein